MEGGGEGDGVGWHGVLSVQCRPHLSPASPPASLPQVEDTPLHDATSEGSVEAAKVLVEGGADVNARSKVSPIRLCVGVDLEHRGFTEATFPQCEPTLGLTCPPSASDRQDKKTPLHRAASNGKTETMKVLVAASADLNLRNKVRIRPAVVFVLPTSVEFLTC